MIITNDNNKSVLAKCFEDAISLRWRGALTGVHVDTLGLRLVKLSRLHEGFAHLTFETPSGAPDPPPGAPCQNATTGASRLVLNIKHTVRRCSLRFQQFQRMSAL